MTDLVRLVDISIEAEDEQFQFGPAQTWRCSNLGRCLRAQVMDRMGVPKAQMSTKTLVLLRIGTLLERKVVEWLGRQIPVLATNVKVDIPQYDAAGSADALIRVGNEIAVLEVKSTRDRGVEYTPYENHVLQADAYRIFLGLPLAFLYYMGRDGARACHVILPDADREQRIRREWDTLGMLLDRGETPPRLPWVQATKKVKIEGKEVEVPFVYERSGAWGEAGTPKFEPPKGGSYCAYYGTGECCADVRT